TAAEEQRFLIQVDQLLVSTTCAVRQHPAIRIVQPEELYGSAVTSLGYLGCFPRQAAIHPIAEREHRLLRRYARPSETAAWSRTLPSNSSPPVCVRRSEPRPGTFGHR